MKWSDIKSKPREIDRLIRKRVMTPGTKPIPWSPSTNIADAWEVVEKMEESGYYYMIRYDQVSFWKNGKLKINIF